MLVMFNILTQELQMRVIEVAEEVYRELQRRAEPFVDTPEDVIRRLLELDSQSAPTAPAQTGEADLVSHAGRVPHGAQLRATYKGREFTAEVLNGRVIWNGRAFDTLSSAAVGVIQSTGTKRGTENGWRFWQVREHQSAEWKPATEYQRR
jgi:hypothetical protein